jgi:shikimate kinase
MNIIFTGYRCTGKTSTGRRLAERLGCDFHDVDDVIVARAGRSVEQIVAGGGWPVFREIERAVIAELSGRDQCVIAPGGGAIIDARNVDQLKKNGLFVWLVADSATIVRRLTKDQTDGMPRPSLTGKPVETEVQEVLVQREPIYRRIADLQVDTTRRTVNEVAETILHRLQRIERRITVNRPPFTAEAAMELPAPIQWARHFRSIADLIVYDDARTAEAVAALIVQRIGRDRAKEMAAAIRAGIAEGSAQMGTAAA